MENAEDVHLLLGQVHVGHGLFEQVPARVDQARVDVLRLGYIRRERECFRVLFRQLFAKRLTPVIREGERRSHEERQRLLHVEQFAN